MQRGDYLLADGNLLPKGTTLTEEQKAALLSAYDEGKAAVSAAVTEQEINEAYEAAVSAMNSVTA